MRPKKRILLIDTDEERMGARRFLLNTHGYAALGATTIAEAMEHLNGTWFDLILAAWPLKDYALTDLLLRTIDAPKGEGLPVILIAKSPKEVRVAANVILPGLVTTQAELLACVKLMSARKRGPRKGSVYSKPPASVAPADDLATRSAS